MNRPTAHEAMIYLMVVTSASDREMTDFELGRIGEVVRTWPVFLDFRADRIVAVAQDCQKLIAAGAGLDGIVTIASETIPERLHDTAYAAAFEVAAVDLEMRMEELRVLELLRDSLSLQPETIRAIEMANKVRHRVLN